MPHSWNSPDSQPCLWMAAGLINYRLCDRDFDCEHCPLDAALRGDSRPAGSQVHHVGSRPPGNFFPVDRRYSTGHTWVQRIDNDGTRLGLDAFAANMLDGLIEVRGGLEARARGETFTELRLDSGSVSLSLPVSAGALSANPRLCDEPTLALTDPYGDGWLTDLTDVHDLDDLLAAEEALEQARQDLRLFRRRVALEMLTDAGDLGRCMADGGEPLTDLRQMLGSLHFCSLLRELIH